MKSISELKKLSIAWIISTQCDYKKKTENFDQPNIVFLASNTAYTNKKNQVFRVLYFNLSAYN